MEKQVLRYSDIELELIKAIFAENDEIVKTLRKHFLQLNQSAVDLSLLEANIKGQVKVLELIRKTLLPTLDGDAPLHQIIDLWMTISIQELTPDGAMLQINARQVVIDYLEQQVSSLEGKGKQEILFEDLINMKDKTPDEVYINLTARNTLISHIEGMLGQLLGLAGLKVETTEEMKKRLAKDSTK